MKIVEKEYCIPAKTVITTIYVASDGKEFISEYDCMQYEKQLEIKNHPTYKSMIENVSTFEDEHYGTLHYISSQEDYEYFKETKGIKNNYRFDSNFDEYGAGWYLYWTEDGGDYPDDKYLKNYDAYESDVESRWNEYKKYMRHKMKQKSI